MTNVVSHTIGNIDIAVLTDGATEFGTEVFAGTDPDTIAHLLSNIGRTTLDTNFNALLIRLDGKIVLVDAGLRDLFGPAGGRLPDALDELGIANDAISTLVITHLHPDHIGGCITAEGEAVFKNAELLVAETERSFWNGQDVASLTEDQQDMHSLAMSVLSAYSDRLTCVKASAGIGQGISLVPMPGHTPGHLGVQIESAGETFLYFTDIINSPYLQLQDPNICAVFDVDREQAIATRQSILDRLAHEKTLCSGGHILAPALGYIERRKTGYAFTPK